MSEKDDGGPAFPVGSGDMRDPVGMSLRDWFAGQALTGVIRDARASTIEAGEWSGLEEEDTVGNADLIASQCYVVADALLAARKEAP